MFIMTDTRGLLKQRIDESKQTKKHTPGQGQSGLLRRHTNTNHQTGLICFSGLDIYLRRAQSSKPGILYQLQLEPNRGGSTGHRGSNIVLTFLSVSRTRLSVALAIGGAVSGIRVSSSWWRSDSVAWRWGVGWARLVPRARLGTWGQAVVRRLRCLRGIVLGWKGSWWVLLWSLS